MLIDSNMWCFYFDDSSKENNKVSQAIEGALTKQQILSNTVVLMEVSHFLVKNLGPRIGKEKIDVLLSFPMTVLDMDFSLMKHSVDMLCDYSHTGIGGRDATLLATLKRTSTNKIMTNDGAFKKIDWVEVFDPLDEARPKSNEKKKHRTSLEKDWNNKHDERWNKG
ncbi:MAG TPA: type II toxin-antitoxin system VapC family toxin [Candidatus Aenigmarchaeota archaeon]|nr:type II toxin-antitoxin system VapC family toxin [Candidatus Aenigmarchaeota archaeon]